jgi:hypothetical protein
MPDAPLPKTRWFCEMLSGSFLSISLNTEHAVVRVTDPAVPVNASLALTPSGLIDLGKELIQIGETYRQIAAEKVARDV